MVEAIDEDICDGMQCINHPFTKNPGGICALCLQEKLGKLVTSSFPLPKHLSSSSSSSPSFRSDTLSSSTNTSASAASLSLSLSKPHTTTTTTHKLPFLLAKKKKKMLAASSSSVSAAVYKRSQSTTTSRNSAYREEEDFSPRKRNTFWSFLHLYSSKHHNNNNTKKVENFHDSSRTKPINQSENRLTKEKNQTDGSSSSSSSSSMTKRVVNGVGVNNKNGIDVIVEEDGSPNIVVAVTPSNGSSFERKVSRSRSVGCGSRSFSGDFFERITNGFGDCTLRRVESQREGNGVNKSKVNNGGGGVREMVRCGGIFGGFMIMTSSSSSSSSSSWVSSSSTDHHNHQHNMVKNRSWGWSFASPMRAFTATSSSGKRGRVITDSAGKNTTTSTLAAIPSLLAVKS